MARIDFNREHRQRGSPRRTPPRAAANLQSFRAFAEAMTVLAAHRRQARGLQVQP